MGSLESGLLIFFWLIYVAESVAGFIRSVGNVRQ